jgi:phage terminase small subunit
MAREAGFETKREMVFVDATEITPTLQRLVELARADEREACAKLCDDINAKYKWPDDVAERVASQWCADAIRARGNT